MRKINGLALALGILLCAATANAQPGGFGKNGFGGRNPFGKDFGGAEKKSDDAKPTKDEPKITRWEYRVETPASLGGGGATVAGMNKLGNDGWELIAVEPGQAAAQVAKYIFRRPLTGQAKAKADKKPAVQLEPKEKAEPRLEVRMYILKHASAQDAAALITDVLRTNRAEPMRIAADARTNQVVVNASQPMQTEIAEILQRLDLPDATELAPGGNKKTLKLPGRGK
jgi:type II/III secretion system protein